MVPQATITFYFAPNIGIQQFYDCIYQAITNNNVVSLSWGSDEYNIPSSYSQTFQAMFAQYANVPVFIASGDSGAYSQGSTIVAAGFPNNCPNAIGKNLKHLQKI